MRLARQHFAMVALIVLAGSAQYASAALIGYYPLNEGTGATTISDSSGFGTPSNLAVLPGTGTILTGQSGKLGNAATFVPGTVKNGALQESSSAAKYDDITTAVTVSLWVKPSDVSYYQVLAEDRNGTGAWVLAFTDGKPELQVRTNTGGSGTWTVLPAADAVSLDTWYNIVGSYDGASMKLYVNGGSPVSAAKTGSIKGAPRFETLTLGNYYSPSSLEVSGSLDDVAVWNTALGDGKAISLSSGANVLGYDVGKMDMLFQVYDGTLPSYTDGNVVWTKATGLSLGLGQASATAVQFDLTGGGVIVPEPGTLALLAAGLVGLLAYAWRKRK